jgi:hypothetical protein
LENLSDAILRKESWEIVDWDGRTVLNKIRKKMDDDDDGNLIPQEESELGTF